MCEQEGLLAREDHSSNYSVYLRKKQKARHISGVDSAARKLIRLSLARYHDKPAVQTFIRSPRTNLQLSPLRP